VKYLLDTDTLSQIARGRHEGVAKRAGQHSTADMAVSVITVGELRYGFALSGAALKLQLRTEALLVGMACLNVDDLAAAEYGKLRAYLQKRGQPIGPNDQWIAAQALAAGLTLVTGNTREFMRVPDLKVENWLR
jgi:tRNA(fMet)-specific endonuclease VapC